MNKIGIWITIVALASMAACADIKADTNATEISVQKCTGCHGKNFDKKALGKSKVVSEMKYSEIKTALAGYQDGTYGGTMKGLMVGQVKDMNETSIDAMSMHIARDCNETVCIVK